MSSSTRSIARRCAIAAAGLAGTAALVLGSGAAAFAGTPPTGTNLPATVVVSTPTIALSMSTTSLSLSAQPGQTADSGPGAVNYTVTASDSHGYNVSVAAPNLTSGSNVLNASALTDMWSVSPGASGSPTAGNAVLSNAGTVIYSQSEPSHDGSGAADQFTEEWTAAIPGSQPAGSYSTTISYVATGL
jgi:hypothetical protein